MDARTALLISTIASIHMGAISLYVGLVHYPTFRRIPPADWKAFHVLHSSRTSWAVGPPIALQSLAAVVLAARPPAEAPWIGPAVLAGWVLSVGWTGAVSVPCHTRLAVAKDGAAIDRLIRTNHVRTVAWFATGVASAWAVGLV